MAVKYLGEGTELMEKKETERAFEKVKKSAEAGLPEGRLALGRCYAEGIGCVQDMELACKWLNHPELIKKYPLAKSVVGMCSLRGIGTAKNLQRGFELLSDPEVAKSPEFLTILGLCHLQGAGTPQDFDKAAECLQKAADGGNEEAQNFLGYENGKRPEWPVPLPQILRSYWKENPTPCF